MERESAVSRIFLALIISVAIIVVAVVIALLLFPPAPGGIPTFSANAESSGGVVYLYHDGGNDLFEGSTLFLVNGRPVPRNAVTFLHGQDGPWTAGETIRLDQQGTGPAGQVEVIYVRGEDRVIVYTHRWEPTPTLTPTVRPTQAPTPTAAFGISATLTSTITATVTANQTSPGNRPPDVNPLTGLKVTDPALLKRRPIMVRVGNDSEARPQVGLNRADVVYEELVEWWITRFTAIYLSQDPEIIARFVPPGSLTGNWGRNTRARWLTPVAPTRCAGNYRRLTW
ncbi:MAG: DUF3048 domain-containing protein [Methanoregulaceae archaeon]|nr:DUF3048 domain-containing protein [Methanoregulaceae archaeon]